MWKNSVRSCFSQMSRSSKAVPFMVAVLTMVVSLWSAKATVIVTERNITWTGSAQISIDLNNDQVQDFFFAFADQIYSYSITITSATQFDYNYIQCIPNIGSPHFIQLLPEGETITVDGDYRKMADFTVLNSPSEFFVGVKMGYEADNPAGNLGWLRFTFDGSSLTLNSTAYETVANQAVTTPIPEPSAGLLAGVVGVIGGRSGGDAVLRGSLPKFLRWPSGFRADEILTEAGVLVSERGLARGE